MLRSTINELGRPVRSDPVGLTRVSFACWDSRVVRVFVCFFARTDPTSFCI